MDFFDWFIVGFGAVMVVLVIYVSVKADTEDDLSDEAVKRYHIDRIKKEMENFK